MKMKGDKSHLPMLGNKSVEAIVNISGYLIKESDEEKLLRVTIDKKLNFKSHVNRLFKKASQKVHALARRKTVLEKTGENLCLISTYIDVYGKATLRINNYHFHNVIFQLLSTGVDVSR